MWPLSEHLVKWKLQNLDASLPKNLSSTILLTCKYSISFDYLPTQDFPDFNNRRNLIRAVAAPLKFGKVCHTCPKDSELLLKASFFRLKALTRSLGHFVELELTRTSYTLIWSWKCPDFKNIIFKVIEVVAHIPHATHYSQFEYSRFYVMYCNNFKM